MNNLRFALILIIVALPVAAWLSYEFLKIGGEVPTVASGNPPKADPASPASVVPPTIPSAPRTTSLQKCVGRGATIYTDQPCPTGTSPQTMATFESAGLAPERPLPLPPPATPPRPMPTGAILEAPAQPAPSPSCAEITAEVARIDARLRQPYAPQEGDWWKARRKAWMDLRFGAGC